MRLTPGPWQNSPQRTAYSGIKLSLSSAWFSFAFTVGCHYPVTKTSAVGREEARFGRMGVQQKQSAPQQIPAASKVK